MSYALPSAVSGARHDTNRSVMLGASGFRGIDMEICQQSKAPKSHSRVLELCQPERAEAGETGSSIWAPCDSLADFLYTS